MIKTIQLINKYGNSIELINYGARIGSIIINTTNGPVNVSLDYSDKNDYLTDPYYLGASIGRYANRLKRNNDKISLHGDEYGFDKRFWELKSHKQTEAIFTYLSEDGEEGFSGNLEVTATFTWTDENKLGIEYQAKTDRETVINLTSHPYFNLNGKGTIDDHFVKIHSDFYTEVDLDFLPTGNIRPTKETELDFNTCKPVLNTEVDYNFIIECNGEVNTIAELSTPSSEISLLVKSNQPGLHFYTGHHLKTPFTARAGLCIEAQNYPDAPNHMNFPSATLKPGDIYKNIIQYEFKSR